MPLPLGPITPTSSPEAKEAVTPRRIRVAAAMGSSLSAGSGLRGEKVGVEEADMDPLGSYPSPIMSTRTGRTGDRLVLGLVRLTWVGR